MFMAQAVNVGLSVYLPVYLQSFLGLSVSASGFALLGLLTGTVVGAAVSGRMAARVVHYKRIAIFGVAFAILCLLSMAYVAGSASLTMIEILTIGAGIGTGTTFPVATVSVQNAVEQTHLGVATGVLTFLRSLGGALGVAMLGAVALGYGLPLAAEGSGTAGPAPAMPFTMIFLATALTMLCALVALGLMPEKPLRGYAPEAAPLVE